VAYFLRPPCTIAASSQRRRLLVILLAAAGVTEHRSENDPNVDALCFHNIVSCFTDSGTQQEQLRPRRSELNHDSSIINITTINTTYTTTITITTTITLTIGPQKATTRYQIISKSY